MPFLKVRFSLTPEQMAACKPIQDALAKANTENAKGTVIGEIFVMEGDWRCGTAIAYFLDAEALSQVSNSLVKAQKEFDEREAKAERLRSVLASISNVVINSGVAVIRRDGHEYEVRETQPTPSAEGSG